jgi:hypothetical protein
MKPPPQSFHSNEAVGKDELLRGKAVICEEIATTMEKMVESLGLPRHLLKK